MKPLNEILNKNEFLEIDFHELFLIILKNKVSHADQESFENNEVIKYLINDYKHKSFKYIEGNWSTSFRLTMLDDSQSLIISMYNSGDFSIESTRKEQHNEFRKKIAFESDMNKMSYDILFIPQGKPELQYKHFNTVEKESKGVTTVIYDIQSKYANVYEDFKNEILTTGEVREDLFDLISMKHDYINPFLKKALMDSFNNENMNVKNINLNNKILNKKEIKVNKNTL